MDIRDVPVPALLNRVQCYHSHTGNMSDKDSSAFLRGVVYAQHMLLTAMLKKLEELGSPITEADLQRPQYGKFPLAFCVTQEFEEKNNV